MPVLDPSEYDASYFDGAYQAMRHNAGYGRYRRWRSTDDSRMTGGRTSSGEFWLDWALEAAAQWGLSPNDKVLEIGCAKGFLVEDLVDAGYDVQGVDVSDWALNTCPGYVGDGSDAAATIRRPDLAGRFHLIDAATGLKPLFHNNEFDVVFSIRVMECFSDAQLPGMISDMNAITKRVQIHIIDEFTAGQIATHYNAKPIEDWLAMGWEPGTRLIPHERPNDIRVK